MPSVSQTVLIDSIKKTILLDEKAVVAQGNIIRQRDALEDLYVDSKTLIDSLFKQVLMQQQELNILNDTVVAPLKKLAAEKTNELNFHIEKAVIKEDYYTAEVKRHKNKKWAWLGVGGLSGIILGFLLAN